MTPVERVESLLVERATAGGSTWPVPLLNVMLLALALSLETDVQLDNTIAHVQLHGYDSRKCKP